MKKRIISWLLLAALLITSIPAYASPEEMISEEEGIHILSEDIELSAEPITTSAISVNPLYEDIYTEQDIASSITTDPVETFDETFRGITYLESLDEVADILREGLVKRQSSITFYFYYDKAGDYGLSTNEVANTVQKEIMELALKETGNPVEGDYLRYHLKGWGFDISSDAHDCDFYYHTMTYTPTYMTTYEQESAVTNKVNELLDNELNFGENASDYEKVYRVHDYISSHVAYDYEHLEDKQYLLKYSAYAALINGTAVCQGYTSLYYRLLRELGVNVRIATGYGGVWYAGSFPTNHAWNVVEVDGKWYHCDATWDSGYNDKVTAGTYTYQYLLKGSSDFDKIDAPYSTDGVHYMDNMGEDFRDSKPSQKTKYIYTGAALCDHTYGSKYSHDEDYHWRTCTKCGDPSRKDTHSGGTATYGEKAKCTLCGTAYGDLADLPFTDVVKTDWFYENVRYMLVKGIMTGTTKTTFAPTENLARAQFTVMLYRMNNSPKVTFTNTFKDIEKGVWYSDSIIWASKIGVVTGYNSGDRKGCFGPGDPINREQMAVMLYRYAKNYKKYDVSESVSIKKYKDASQVSEFAVEAMQWAVGAGIITGKDNQTRLAPLEGATRAECAAIVMRFLEKYESK